MNYNKYFFSLLNGGSNEGGKESDINRIKMVEYLEYRYKISREDAEDVVQNVMLNMLEMKQRNVLREPENSRAYMFTVLKRECLKTIRNNDKRCSYTEEKVDLYENPSQLEELHFNEKQKILEDCISKMTEFNQKFIQYLIDNPENTADEIGSYFGLKTSNVWTRKHRIRKWIYNCFMEKNDDSKPKKK